MKQTIEPTQLPPPPPERLPPLPLPPSPPPGPLPMPLPMRASVECLDACWPVQPLLLCRAPGRCLMDRIWRTERCVAASFYLIYEPCLDIAHACFKLSVAPLMCGGAQISWSDWRTMVALKNAV